MVKKGDILKVSVKYTAAVVAVAFAVTQCVFAITGFGFLSGGEDKNAKDNASFSNIKSTVTVSIKDKYGISSKDAFTRTHNKALVPEAADNSVVTYKKGNVVYVLPYKNQKSVKMPGFISLAPAQSAPINR
ncbi:MAG: hypothetical protein KIT80_18590 [Chitinophagaceae bacterium]|nr:hypothetical protein [Chitinophagaceae bacterium]MCW5928935.1 hypothetical protein [Chitinophagaceae bacterium]